MNFCSLSCKKLRSVVVMYESDLFYLVFNGFGQVQLNECVIIIYLIPCIIRFRLTEPQIFH